MAAYLLILGSGEGVAWVLDNERMAFREGNAARAARLEAGDRLFLYTTRACFGNPARSSGRIIGEAEVVSTVGRRDTPVTIGGQPFTHDCRISLTSLAPFGEGLELTPLVAELEVFPKPEVYSAKLRRPLLALPSADAKLIRTRLKPHVGPPKAAKGGYIAGGERAGSGR